MKPYTLDLPADSKPSKRTRKTEPRRDLTPEEQRNLADATRATLVCRPSSDAAREACDTLLAKLLTPKQSKPPLPSQKRAFGAIIADVLRTDPSVAGGWVWRSTDNKSFTGELIGAHSFITLYNLMREGNFMLGFLAGRQHFTKFGFDDGGGKESYAVDRRAKRTPLAG